MPTKTTSKPVASKPADEKQVPVVQPAGTEAVKTSELEPLDHSPTRAFQTGSEPGQREYLNQAEAEKRGFHWAETEEEKAAGGTKRKRR